MGSACACLHVDRRDSQQHVEGALLPVNVLHLCVGKSSLRARFKELGRAFALVVDRQLGSEQRIVTFFLRLQKGIDYGKTHPFAEKFQFCIQSRAEGSELRGAPKIEGFPATLTVER